MNLHPSLLSTLLQSKGLPLKKEVTAAVDGLGATILHRTAVRALDTGSGRHTLVFIPEPPNTIEHYRALADSLAETHRVIVYDVPGFGFSYPTFAFDYSVEHQAEALVALLHRLKVRQATVFAPGLMAYAAMAAARQDPLLVERLVLLQSASVPELRAWTGRMDAKVVLIRPWIGQLAAAFGKGHMFKHWYRSVQPEGADLSGFVDHAAWTLSLGAAFCLASTVQQLHACDPTFFEGSEVPIVAVWGDADRSYEGVDPRSIQEHAPQATVEVFEGVGHYPDLEATARLLALLGL